MSGRTCSVDNFSAAITDLIGDAFEGCDKEVASAVGKTTRMGARLLRKKYAIRGAHVWSDEYRDGFSASVKKNGYETIGEIGNRKKPGLVHLLEKGHATLGGGRSRAFPHMEPAFDDMKEVFIKRVDDAVDKALRG